MRVGFTPPRSWSWPLLWSSKTLTCWRGHSNWCRTLTRHKMVGPSCNPLGSKTMLNRSDKSRVTRQRDRSRFCPPQVSTSPWRKCPPSCVRLSWPRRWCVAGCRATGSRTAWLSALGTSYSAPWLQSKQILWGNISSACVPVICAYSWYSSDANKASSGCNPRTLLSHDAVPLSAVVGWISLA